MPDAEDREPRDPGSGGADGPRERERERERDDGSGLKSYPESDPELVTAAWEHTENPADPALSALPGQEKRSYLFPASIIGAVVILVIIVVIAMPHGPRQPYRVLESPDLGYRSEYPSELLPGPNYVKTSDGSILTVERHSLDMAKKDWVAQLPDVLFDQVLIQLQENYAYVNEISRTHLTIDGKRAIEVVMEGLPAGREPLSRITVDIVANDEWVYVLRSYSPKTRDAKERPLFSYFRDHFKMLPSSAPRTAS